jgi:SulP family sulfate permease
MGHESKHPAVVHTPIGRRVVPRGLRETMLGLTAKNLPREVLVGVTLLAIAIPEQLATSQLASVPAFTSMIAFIAATFVFLVLGSNPILSVGADSTIAPLFAVVLLRLALPDSSQYLALVSAAAVLAGLLVAAVGLLRMAWLADFLSLPIVAGFMSGIGVIIIVHQLPRALGVRSSGESALSRLNWLVHQLGHVSAWSVALALGTLALMVVGERLNPRLPMALVAVVGTSVLASALSLSHHGVEALGPVTVGMPTWRLHWFTLHEWGAIVTTALTLVVVIVSQSAATARSSADEIGVADNLNRDFVGIGVANVVAGFCGAIPVNASPARTTVVRLAGGRTKMVGLVAVLGALALSPLATYARTIPLATLAGVLVFVAGRLIKVAQLRVILRTSTTEFILALITALGVILLGVEIGLAVAVGLAILDRTWRSSRPRMVELGRRKGTTSWEPLDNHAVVRVDHLLAILFDETLYFANASVFRREVHELLKRHPDTRHLVIDAVAMSDIDYTGLVALSQVVNDLTRDGISVSVARANALVTKQLSTFSDKALRHVKVLNSVDDAANHALGHPKN